MGEELRRRGSAWDFNDDAWARHTRRRKIGGRPASKARRKATKRARRANRVRR